MANRFLLASIDAIKRNGITASYIQVTTGAYDVETGSVINAETPHVVTLYKKHIRTSQYNYPTLVGKDVGVFYLANNSLTFVPAPKDKIDYNGSTYLVESIEDGIAHSQIVLYKILAIKT